MSRNWLLNVSQLYAEYDEEEIGALDHEEIDGKVSTDGPLMDFLLKQFEKQQVKVYVFNC